jgi:hypothetical protein
VIRSSGLSFWPPSSLKADGKVAVNEYGHYSLVGEVRPLERILHELADAVTERLDNNCGGLDAGSVPTTALHWLGALPKQ